MNAFKAAIALLIVGLVVLSGCAQQAPKAPVTEEPVAPVVEEPQQPTVEEPTAPVVEEPMGPSASTVQPPAVPAGQPAIQAPETPLGTYTGPTPQTTSTKNASMWDCIKQKLSSRFPDAAPGTIPDEEVVKANRECVGYQ